MDGTARIVASGANTEKGWKKENVQRTPLLFVYKINFKLWNIKIIFP